MIEKSVLRELAALVGRKKVFTDREYLLAYSYDATGLECLPDAVVFAEQEADVENVITICRRHAIPLVPRGAGVGYTGGSLAVNGGLVLVFTRMNRILLLDKENFLAEVEPGVITADLQEAAEKIGLFYPPDPASLKTSTMGGNVAENAGGPRCFKYGVTANYVLGLEAFLMSGEKIRLGAHTIKNVAGYDLKALLIGSEGTLAVVTKVIVRLLPLPPRRLLFRVDFSSLAAGARFVQSVIQGHVQPAVLEFMDKSSLQAVYAYQGISGDPRVQAAVLVEIDGSPAEVAEREALFMEQVAMAVPRPLRAGRKLCRAGGPVADAAQHLAGHRQAETQKDQRRHRGSRRPHPGNGGIHRGVGSGIQPVYRAFRPFRRRQHPYQPDGRSRGW